MRIITAILTGALVGTVVSAVMADPMSEAILRGGYNKSEDRFGTTRTNIVPTWTGRAISKADLEKHYPGLGTITVYECAALEFVEKKDFNKLVKRVDDLEKKIYGGPPKHYGF